MSCVCIDGESGSYPRTAFDHLFLPGLSSPPFLNIWLNLQGQRTRGKVMEAWMKTVFYSKEMRDTERHCAQRPHPGAYSVSRSFLRGPVWFELQRKIDVPDWVAEDFSALEDKTCRPESQALREKLFPFPVSLYGNTFPHPQVFVCFPGFLDCQISEGRMPLRLPSVSPQC